MPQFQDPWDSPSDDGPDDFAVAQDGPPPGRRKTPGSQRADQFMALWVEARKTRPTLATPWSAKQAFLSNLKRLRNEQDDQTIEAMIDRFFALLDSGRLTLKSDELWKDFWNNRGTILASVQNQATSVETETDLDIELAKMRNA